MESRLSIILNLADNYRGGIKQLRKRILAAETRDISKMEENALACLYHPYDHLTEEALVSLKISPIPYSYNSLKEYTVRGWFEYQRRRSSDEEGQHRARDKGPRGKVCPAYSGI